MKSIADFRGVRTLVTGASSGIGMAIADQIDGNAHR